MPQIPDYKDLMTEIIKKQSVILGPQIAVLKARAVTGIKVTDSGEVVEVKGDAKKAVQELIDKYVALSGQIVHMTIEPFMTKYPDLVSEIKSGGAK